MKKCIAYEGGVTMGIEEIAYIRNKVVLPQQMLI